MKQISYILLFLMCTLSFAQNTQLFEQANTLYNEGNYVDAIEKYESILKAKKHSSELYFNLGNAHYKLNNIAPSIYYYEKALQLSPKDKDIKNNIAFARNMTIDAIDTLPEVGFSKLLRNAAEMMKFDAWAMTTVTLVVLFIILILSYYFTEGTTKKRLSFIGSISAVLLACIALAFTFHSYNLNQMDNPAIVFAKESRVKSEPNLRSEEAFRLHEGTKVQVLDTVSGWKKIQLSDGKTGWISKKDLKLLNDI